MKKKNKKTKKILGIILPVFLVVILIGTSFQALLMNKQKTNTQNNIIIHLGFRIQEKNYPYQEVKTQNNISIAQFLYTYTNGNIELQSDGSIKRIMNMRNDISMNTFWTTTLNNETIIDTRTLLNNNDYLFLTYG